MTGRLPAVISSTLPASASLGRSIAAVNAAKRNRYFSSRLAFLFHTVRETDPLQVPGSAGDGRRGEPVEARIALVAVANAPYFGGGMKIAPDAVPDDAEFEVVIVRGRSKLSLISDLRLVYSGGHKALPSCTFLKGKKIVVEPLGDLAPTLPFSISTASRPAASRRHSR